MPTEKELIDERIRKLEELRRLGIDPYPYSFKRTHHAADVLAKHKALKANERTTDKVSVAGRIVAFRKLGAIMHPLGLC